MTKINPFFAIGSLGLILHAGLHMFMALVLAQSGIHSSFLMLYPVFISLMILGLALMIRSQKTDASQGGIHS